MVKTYQKAAALLLALALIFALPVPASAAETTEARVPVTLTVVNTVSPISCMVPAALPVSLVDGYVVCANNAAITNTGKTGAIRVAKLRRFQKRQTGNALACGKLKNVGNQSVILIPADFHLVGVILAVVCELGLHAGFPDQSI